MAENQSHILIDTIPCTAEQEAMLSQKDLSKLYTLCSYMQNRKKKCMDWAAIQGQYTMSYLHTQAFPSKFP